jgi:hypothetical protein
MDNARFTVDPDGLNTLSGRLGELVSAVGGIDLTVSMYDPADLGPGNSVASAAEAFSAAWASNLTRVASDVAGLRDRLTSAAASYSGTEEQIAQAATPGTT